MLNVMSRSKRGKKKKYLEDVTKIKGEEFVPQVNAKLEVFCCLYNGVDEEHGVDQEVHNLLILNLEGVGTNVVHN